ncbi:MULTISPECIES: hypothetical protein [Streptomyces]|uniref:Tetratricopeptide repeat protein n=1 Tax=Streptomyces ramulosus TaxID=47762 RepID=A0ABW1FVL6_9ACTN
MNRPHRRPGRALALLHTRSRATEDPSDPSWPGRLAADLHGLDADWRESAEICADAAWAARAAGHSVLSVLTPDQVTAPRLDPITSRTYLHLTGSGLRFDFRCRSLERLVEQLPPRTRAAMDCYSRALHAFALLGQSRPEGLAAMDDVLAECGDHPKVVHVLLHGLWLGHHLDRGPERLLDLASRAPARDPIVLFRVAGALRRLSRYEDGLAAIDQALELLPPGAPAVHADLVRERQMISAAHDLYRHTRTTEATP